MTFRMFVALLLVMIVCPACNDGNSDVNSATELCAEHCKWACVGDSNTEGILLPEETDTYVYKLDELLKNSESEAINFGEDARTMLQDPTFGTSYWESAFFIDSQTYLPDIVSIMLGTNDAHLNNWPALSSDYYQDAIDLVTEYQHLPNRPHVILMTIPPMPTGSDFGPGVDDINAMIPQIVAAASCETVDVFGAIVESGLTESELFMDELHLTGAGQTIIAQLLYDYFNANQEASSTE